jgi:hypothetical protein
MGIAKGLVAGGEAIAHAPAALGKGIYNYALKYGSEVAASFADETTNDVMTPARIRNLGKRGFVALGRDELAARRARKRAKSSK